MVDSARGFMPEGFVSSPQLKRLRTLVAQVAEASPPVAGAFVTSLPRSSFAWIYIIGSTTTGNPDEVIYDTWGLIEDKQAPANNIIVPLDSYVQPASLVAVPVLRPIHSAVSKIWTVVRFTGGTAPTVTANILVRSVQDAALTAANLSFDELRNLYIRSLAYDSLTQADRNIPAHDTSDYGTPETLFAYTTGVGITGTYDLPLNMGKRKHCSFKIQAESGVANSIQFGFRGTNDLGSAVPFYVFKTKGGYNSNTDTYLSAVPPVADLIVVPTGGITTYDIHYEECGDSEIQCRLVAVANAGNKFQCEALKWY